MTTNADIPDWTTPNANPTSNVLGSPVSINNGQTTVTTGLTIPLFATGMVITCPPALTGLASTTTLTVIGVLTGRTYVDGLVSPAGKGLSVVLGAAIASESTLTITVTWSAPCNVGNTTAANAVVLVGTGVSEVVASIDQPLPVSIPGTVNVSEVGPVQVSSINSITATVESGIGNLKPASSFAASVPSNSTTPVIAAVVGKVVTIYGYELMILTNSVTETGGLLARFQDTAGNNQFANCGIVVETASSAPQSRSGPLWIPGGWALPVSVGLNALNNNSGNAFDMAWTVWYTQV